MPRISTPTTETDDEEIPRDDYEDKDKELDREFLDEDEDENVEDGEETIHEPSAEIDLPDDF